MKDKVISKLKLIPPTVINNDYWDSVDSHYKDLENFQYTNDTSGTSLQGRLSITYDQLKKVFGNPHAFYESGKVDCEWNLKFPSNATNRGNRTFTIYNWKNGINYLGKEGLDLEDITRWNIGGYNKSVYWDLLDLLDIKGIEVHK